MNTAKTPAAALICTAITSMWHIGFDDARKPSQAEIDQALKLVDYTKVKFNDKEQTVYLEEKGMQLDLGALLHHR